MRRQEARGAATGHRADHSAASAPQASAQPARAAARPRRGRLGRARRRRASCGVGDRARGGDEPAGAAGRERGRERRDVAALGADAGQQERRARHQLAQAREVLGLGRAGDGADVGEPARPGVAELGDERARGAPTAARRRRARGRARRRRRGWTCARARTRRRRARGPPAISGSSASRPSSGLAVKASAPRPATGERRRRRADQRLRVGGGGDRDVAALAVGEHEQARARGRARTTCSSASQPGAPSRSKHASCGLTATHAGPAASISARQWASTAAAASSRATRRRRPAARRRRPPAASGRRRERGGERRARRRPPRRSGHSRAGSGSIPSDDLRLACRDRVREPFTERLRPSPPAPVRRRCCRRAGVSWSSGYLMAFLRPEPAVKRGTLLAAISSSRRCAGCDPRERRARRRGTSRSR